MQLARSREAVAVAVQPEAQRSEDGVLRVQCPVAVVVEGGEVDEAIGRAAHVAEELRTIVDEAVTVAIEREESFARADPRRPDQTPRIEQVEACRRGLDIEHRETVAVEVEDERRVPLAARDV